MRDFMLIHARLDLLPAEISGRTAPVYSGYRPVHNFGEPNNRELWFGQIEWTSGHPLFPGESIEVTIQFHDEPYMKDQLVIGRKWRVQDGGTLVAIAEVLEKQETPPPPR